MIDLKLLQVNPQKVEKAAKDKGVIIDIQKIIKLEKEKSELGSSVQKLGKREILPRQRKFVLLNSMPCLLSSCPHYFAPNHFASHFSTPIFLLCHPGTPRVSLRLIVLPKLFTGGEENRGISPRSRL